MRTPTILAAAAAAALIALTGCSDPDADHAGMSDEGTTPPPYTVIKDTNKLGELLVPNATKDSATAALNDWIGRNIRDRDTFTAQVVRTRDAGTIVCRATYYADQKTADVHTNGTVTSGSWPHTTMECPDPTAP
ncbi:hypothetical protein [Streptomyces purpureus]|uniref:Lipoprotein n=1 Tax=Streptomyces purpureus TaxID=1951 RepID=A0A918H853_9ACTN|nr:hypothetical protein [Streptomyces purpureus]GGT43439.1 hypothetical protein GCM10014713_41420 [Streptomyces purpureus]